MTISAAHIVDATTYKLFGTYDDEGTATVTMEGFAAYEAAKENAAANNYCGVMSGFKPTDLPVINKIASEFAVFDRFFASVPGASCSQYNVVQPDL